MRFQEILELVGLFQQAIIVFGIVPMMASRANKKPRWSVSFDGDFGNNLVAQASPPSSSLSQPLTLFLLSPCV